MTMPSSLCKYFTFENHSFVRDRLVRFTQPTDLNDPYELVPAVQKKSLELHFRRALKREERRLLQKVKSGPVWGRSHSVAGVKRSVAEYWQSIDCKKLHAEWVKSFKDYADKRLGVLSLSERWDSPAMWAHYSNNHTGYCVEFDVRHEFFNKEFIDGDRLGALNAVSYGDARIQIDISPPFDDHGKIALAFYQKSNDWRYEKEYRVLRLLDCCSQEIRRPFQLPIHLFEIPLEAVKTIYVGLYAKPERVAECKAFARKADCRCFQVCIDSSSYNFGRDEIAARRRIAH